MSSEIPYAFDAADADLILRSSHQTLVGQVTEISQIPTEFRVHWAILSAASTVFRDMCTFPQPSGSNEGNVPVVPLSEPLPTLHLLLRFIYPLPEPTIPDLSTLALILEPAVKYDAEGVIGRLKSILVSPRFMETEPLRVYAIACRWGFETEAKFASTHTLCISILEAPCYEEYDYMPTSAFHRLLSFHRKRSRDAVKIVDTEPLPGGGTCSPGNRFYEEFRERAREELLIRPSTSVITSLRFTMQIMNQPYQNCCGCNGVCRTRSEAFQSFVFSLTTKIDNLASMVDVRNVFVTGNDYWLKFHLFR